MLTLELETIAEFAIDGIAAAEVIEEPFPHIIVDEFLPEAVFKDVIANLPDRSQCREVRYPGTGCGKKMSRYRENGLVYKDMRNHEHFRVLDHLFASEAFSRALLTKFSRPLPNGFVPIPLEKHHLFAAGSSDYSCGFDFHIDRPGYEIPPHTDVADKIVTFQYFLVEDDSLRDYGTLLCKPRGGRSTARRAFLPREAGRLLDRFAAHLRLERSRFYRKLERSRLGLCLGVGTTRNWLPWGSFEVAKVVHASPNHFMAFAPNSISYHAVRMDIPAESAKEERPVIRGFIWKGPKAVNLIEDVEVRSNI